MPLGIRRDIPQDNLEPLSDEENVQQDKSSGSNMTAAGGASSSEEEVATEKERKRLRDKALVGKEVGDKTDVVSVRSGDATEGGEIEYRVSINSTQSLRTESVC